MTKEATTNEKKDWIFYGRYGDEPWDSDYFGSQDACDRELMTYEEAISLGERLLKDLTPYQDEEEEEARGGFEWKVEEVETEEMYFECVIRPHHGGFGMWEASTEEGEPWADEYDLLAEVTDVLREGEELYELGVDKLPSHCEDIRGHIYNEPDRVFVIDRGNGECDYFGIFSKEV